MILVYGGGACLLTETISEFYEYKDGELILHALAPTPSCLGSGFLCLKVG